MIPTKKDEAFLAEQIQRALKAEKEAVARAEKVSDKIDDLRNKVAEYRNAGGEYPVKKGEKPNPEFIEEFDALYEEHEKHHLSYRLAFALRQVLEGRPLDEINIF